MNNDIQNQRAVRRAEIRNALLLGVMCSVSYLAIYFARNILGAVTPHMLEEGFSNEYFGHVSSIYFITYAVGQLVNGAIGDRVKAKYMIFVGLVGAAVTNMIFVTCVKSAPTVAMVSYGIMGYFLSMIYGPILKLASENTNPLDTPKCTLGFTFASFVGTPLAGVAAMALYWKTVFHVASLWLVLMAVLSFTALLAMEKKKWIRYNVYRYEKDEKGEKDEKEKKGGSMKLLLRRGIVKFTIVSILTGVIRTAVIFWMPTYFKEHLGLSADTASMVFSVCTFIASLSIFVAMVFHEVLMRRNGDRTVFALMALAAVFFLLTYFFKTPMLNVVLLTAAVLFSDSAASEMFSYYCPSLRDTGRVSSVTGFLDFVSYVAASIASSAFAEASTQFGWNRLVLVWFILMAVGTVATIPIRFPLFRQKSE